MNSHKIITQNKYQKYIKEVINTSEKMSLFYHQSGSNIAVIEGSRVKFNGILFAYVREDFHICCGQIGEDKIFICNDDHIQDTNSLSLIIDERKADKKRFHLNYSDQFVTLSDIDFYSGQELIITFLENTNFAQLQIYDSHLKYNKFGEYFADTPSTIGSAKSFALGKFVDAIPGIADIIPDLFERASED